MWPFNRKKREEVYVEPVPINDPPIVEAYFVKPHFVLKPHEKFIDLLVWKAKNHKEVAFNEKTARQLFNARYQVAKLNEARLETYLKGCTPTQKAMIHSIDQKHFWLCKQGNAWIVRPYYVRHDHIATKYENSINGVKQ